MSLKTRLRSVPIQPLTPPPIVAEAVAKEGHYGPAHMSREAADAGLAKYTPVECTPDAALLGTATADLGVQDPWFWTSQNFVPLSHDETIDHMRTKHTSPGYGHRDQNKTVSEMVSDPGTAAYLSRMWDDAVEKGVYPEVKALNCLKDEIRLEGKNARQFNPFTIEFFYIMLRLFGKSHDVLCNNPLRGTSALGFNPYGGGWADLIEKLTEGAHEDDEYVWDDAKSLDRTIPAIMFYALYNYKASFFDAKYRKTVMWVAKQLVHTHIVFYDGVIYVKASGNPSGQFLTADDNTFFRQIALNYAYRKLFNCLPSEMGEAHTHYGDDGAARIRGHSYREVRDVILQDLGIDLIYETSDNVSDVEFLSKKTAVAPDGRVGFYHCNFAKMWGQLNYWNGNAASYALKVGNFMQMCALLPEVYDWLSDIRNNFIRLQQPTEEEMRVINFQPTDRAYCLAANSPQECSLKTEREVDVQQSQMVTSRSGKVLTGKAAENWIKQNNARIARLERKGKKSQRKKQRTKRAPRFSEDSGMAELNEVEELCSYFGEDGCELIDNFLSLPSDPAAVFTLPREVPEKKKYAREMEKFTVNPVRELATDFSVPSSGPGSLVIVGSTGAAANVAATNSSQYVISTAAGSPVKFSTEGVLTKQTTTLYNLASPFFLGREMMCIPYHREAASVNYAPVAVTVTNNGAAGIVCGVSLVVEGFTDRQFTLHTGTWNGAYGSHQSVALPGNGNRVAFTNTSTTWQNPVFSIAEESGAVLAGASFRFTIFFGTDYSSTTTTVTTTIAPNNLLVKRTNLEAQPDIQSVTGEGYIILSSADQNENLSSGFRVSTTVPLWPVEATMEGDNLYDAISSSSMRSYTGPYKKGACSYGIQGSDNLEGRELARFKSKDCFTLHLFKGCNLDTPYGDAVVQVSFWSARTYLSSNTLVLGVNIKTNPVLLAIYAALIISQKDFTNDGHMEAFRKLGSELDRLGKALVKPKNINKFFDTVDNILPRLVNSVKLTAGAI